MKLLIAIKDLILMLALGMMLEIARVCLSDKAKEDIFNKMEDLLINTPQGK